MLKLDGLKGPGFGPVDLTVEAGACLSILGESGSGKTRLLRAIADLDPSQGSCSLDGVPAARIPAMTWRCDVAYVPAEPGWWAPTALEHFSDRQVCERFGSMFGIGSAALTRPVEELSTGERQRLALARALQFQPRVLLLDEPTGPLDGSATKKVEAEIRVQMETGVAVVLVTHDGDQAGRLGADVRTLSEGRLV